MKYKVFVISLKENNYERRFSVQKQFQSRGIKFEFVDAVLGSNINKVASEECEEGAYWMRDGQIGCALSHMRCYQKIVDENLDFAFVSIRGIKYSNGSVSYFGSKAA